MWLPYCNICFFAVVWNQTRSISKVCLYTPILFSFSFTYTCSNNDISQNNISGPVHKHTKAMTEVNEISMKLKVIRSFMLMSPALLFPVTICEKLLLRSFCYIFVSNKILIIVCSYLVFHLIFISLLATCIYPFCFSVTIQYKDNQCFHLSKDSSESP